MHIYFRYYVVCKVRQSLYNLIIEYHTNIKLKSIKMNNILTPINLFAPFADRAAYIPSVVFPLGQEGKCTLQ